MFQLTSLTTEVIFPTYPKILTDRLADRCFHAARMIDANRSDEGFPIGFAVLAIGS